MAQKGGDITTKFKVDISDLKAGISEANKQIKLANAEFKAASAGMDDWAKSSEGINAKLKQLDSVLQSETKKLQSYKDQLQKVEEASQENGKRANELKTKLQQLASQGVSKTSAEYQKYEKALSDVEKEQLSNQSAADKLKITILNQEAAVNKTEKEMKEYEGTLKEVAKAEQMSAKNGKSVEDNLKKIRKETEEADGGFTILKGTLANLTANVITSAISKIGELAGSLFDLIEATEEYRSMMAKLEGATNTYGYEIDYTKDKFKEFYRYLGDSQMANNAISNLLGLQVETGTLDKLVNAAISTWSMYGDSMPIESLTESINETIQVGKVTGTFADTLNWTRINQEELSASLGNGSAAQKAFNQAISEGEAVEDAFSAALAATSDQGERANIVANFLNSTYGESKTTYDELNGAMLDANESELNLIDSQAKLAEAVSPVKDVFTQLKTQALEAILPIVTDLAQKFLDLKAYLEEHPGVLVVVTTAVSALAAAFGVLATALAIQGLIKGVTVAIDLLNKTIGKNPIVLVVSLIAGLVAAFIHLWNTSEEFRNFWIGLWEGIKSVCQTVIDAVVGFFTTAWDNIKAVWSVVSQWFSDAFNAIWESVKPVVDSIVNVFKEAWELIKVVWDLVKPYFEAIWTAIQTVFSVVKDVLFGFFNAAWTAIKGVWDVVVQYFTLIWENIKAVFSVVKDVLFGFFNLAWEAIKAVWDTVTGFFKAIWDTIAGIFSVVKDVLTGNFSDAWESIKGIVSTWGEFFSGIWDNIKKVFSGVKDFFKNSFKSAWTAVKNIFSNWGSFFKGLWDTITNTFKKVGTTIADAISGSVKKAVNGVLSGAIKIINGFISALNTAISIINAIPGVNISKLEKLNVPKLEKGGILKKGQVGFLEGNGAEAVVPLDKNKYWIKAVADDMRNELQGGVASSTSNLANSNVNNFTQIINAPKTPSRIELYRDARNLLNYTKRRA